jgi:hypothetical protein
MVAPVAVAHLDALLHHVRIVASRRIERRGPVAAGVRVAIRMRMDGFHEHEIDERIPHSAPLRCGRGEPCKMGLRRVVRDQYDAAQIADE